MAGLLSEFTSELDISEPMGKGMTPVDEVCSLAVGVPIIVKGMPMFAT